MTKTERHELIDSLVSEGATVEEIKAQVAEKAGVTENTVIRDLEKLYPSLVGDSSSGETPPEEDSESNETTTPTPPEEVKAAEKKETEDGILLTLKLSGKTETDKGRLTEYLVEKNAQNLVHVELEKVSSKTEDGNVVKTSRPYIQRFDKRSWNQFRAHAKNLGYSYIKVLYAPEGVDFSLTKPDAPKK